MEGITEELIQNDTSETIVVDDIPPDDLHEQSGYLTDPEAMETNIISQSSTDVVVEVNKGPERKMEKIVQLPITRIKNLMKLDPDVNIASHDAVIAIAKAAVSFLIKVSSYF